MRAIWNYLLDLLFPPKCMLCGTIIESSQEYLCRQCKYEDLPEYTVLPPVVPYFESCIPVFRYKEPVRDAMLRFKFHGMRRYDRQFAAWMAALVRDKLEGKYDLISWVPCSGLRAWSRGYDQAELLANALAKELDRPVMRTLQKVRHNRKQSKITDAGWRKANVLDAYRPWHLEQFRGKRILLIDDVLTTGATMSECGKTLRLAGAGELVCAVVAAAHDD